MALEIAFINAPVKPLSCSTKTSRKRRKKMTAQSIKRDLTTKAMLVSLHIKAWNTTKTSSEATDLVQTTFNATSDSGIFKKNLAAKSALKEINTIISSARTFHMENTRPWFDEDSKRIQPSKNYNYYADNMRNFSNQFTTAVENLIAVYPQIKSDAKTTLGNLFNEDDYPTVDQLRKKYSFKVNVSPIPSANDFRVTQISDEDIEAIKKDIQAQQEQIEKELAKDLWVRLHDVLSKAYESFADPDAKFRDSKIDNISEMIEIIKRLDMEEDARLNRMLQVVDERICTLDPAELRKNPEERKDAAETAKSILDRIGSYL